MSKQKKILIFTATYNEISNISKLINNIFSCKVKVDILIVDDNSPDGTGRKISLLQKKNKRLFLISRKKKLGLDSAHKLAYDYAKKNGYEYLITMDADLSHDPKEIKNFINNLNDNHFVIGSRYIAGGKCLMRGRRLLISKHGNRFIKKLLRINISEFTTSYRGFNLKKLGKFNLKKVRTKGYSFFMGTVYEIYKRNYKIKEIPIIFRDRKKGYSKIPRLEIFRTLKNLLFISIKERFFINGALTKNRT